MAISTCAKCGNHTFEIRENSPTHSAFQLLFVQCASCGAVIGVLDYFNIGARIEKQDAALKKIARALNVTIDL